MKKISVLCENKYLLTLLKQYNEDFTIVSDSTSLVKIQDLNDQVEVTAGQKVYRYQKPVEISEILSVIDLEFGQNEFYIIGHLTFFPNKNQLQEKDNEISLTEKESSIIKILYEHQEGIDKEKLTQMVLGHKTKLETHSLENHIYRINQKAEDKIIISKGKLYKLKKD